MSRTIKYSLSPASIASAIRELKAYQRSMKDKADLICQKLAEIGVNTARLQYSAATPEGQNGSVSVEAVKADDGWLVVANGSAVMFLEFGAGDATDTENHLAANAPVEVYPGSYSREHAKQYSERGYWEFGGRIYHEVRAVRGLSWAERDMRDAITRIASEVFNT